MGDWVEDFSLRRGLRRGDDELFTSDGLFRVGSGDRRGWLIGTMFADVF